MKLWFYRFYAPFLRVWRRSAKKRSLLSSSHSPITAAYFYLKFDFACELKLWIYGGKYQLRLSAWKNIAIRKGGFNITEKTGSHSLRNCIDSYHRTVLKDILGTYPVAHRSVRRGPVGCRRACRGRAGWGGGRGASPPAHPAYWSWSCHTGSPCTRQRSPAARAVSVPSPAPFSL
jgi:hypothetical protein